jgi:hypothetical protein
VVAARFGLEAVTCIRPNTYLAIRRLPERVVRVEVLSAYVNAWLSDNCPPAPARAGLSAPACVTYSTRSMRRSVSSRPSSATLSKIPGETVVPEIATRSGW